MNKGNIMNERLSFQQTMLGQWHNHLQGEIKTQICIITNYHKTDHNQYLK